MNVRSQEKYIQYLPQLHYNGGNVVSFDFYPFVITSQVGSKTTNFTWGRAETSTDFEMKDSYFGSIKITIFYTMVKILLSIPILKKLM